MSCREIRLKFSEALDAPRASAERRAIEEHCEGCAICGPEWQTLLRLESMMAEVPAPPRGLADRVMAALPPQAAPEREIMPFVVAGLIAAGVLLAFQLATVAEFAAPVVDGMRQALNGVVEVAKSRTEGATFLVSGWFAAAAAAAGVIAGAALLRFRQAAN